MASLKVAALKEKYNSFHKPGAVRGTFACVVCLLNKTGMRFALCLLRSTACNEMTNQTARQISVKIPNLLEIICTVTALKQANTSTLHMYTFSANNVI